ncbi:MAG: hypothetical protein KDD52_00820 [Bdellovibrionales bacterium]|nr:hypothetical protein [Bdellovibrionales bacterium]
MKKNTYAFSIAISFAALFGQVHNSYAQLDKSIEKQLLKWPTVQELVGVVAQIWSNDDPDFIPPMTGKDFSAGGPPFGNYPRHMPVRSVGLSYSQMHAFMMSGRVRIASLNDEILITNPFQRWGQMGLNIRPNTTPIYDYKKRRIYTYQNGDQPSEGYGNRPAENLKDYVIRTSSMVESITYMFVHLYIEQGRSLEYEELTSDQWIALESLRHGIAKNLRAKYIHQLFEGSAQLENMAGVFQLIRNSNLKASDFVPMFPFEDPSLDMLQEQIKTDFQADILDEFDPDKFDLNHFDAMFDQGLFPIYWGSLFVFNRVPTKPTAFRDLAMEIYKNAFTSTEYILSNVDPENTSPNNESYEYKSVDEKNSGDQLQESYVSYLTSKKKLHQGQLKELEDTSLISNTGILGQMGIKAIIQKNSQTDAYNHLLHQGWNGDQYWHINGLSTFKSLVLDCYDNKALCNGDGVFGVLYDLIDYSNEHNVSFLKSYKALDATEKNNELDQMVGLYVAKNEGVLGEIQVGSFFRDLFVSAVYWDHENQAESFVAFLKEWNENNPYLLVSSTYDSSSKLVVWGTVRSGIDDENLQKMLDAMIKSAAEIVTK